MKSFKAALMSCTIFAAPAAHALAAEAQAAPAATNAQVAGNPPEIGFASTVAGAPAMYGIEARYHFR